MMLEGCFPSTRWSSKRRVTPAVAVFFGLPLQPLVMEEARRQLIRTVVAESAVRRGAAHGGGFCGVAAEAVEGAAAVGLNGISARITGCAC